MAISEPRQSKPTGSAASPKEGQKCPSCGKPMAPEQRYCLECGHRRSDPRVEFREHLFSGPGSAADNGLAQAPTTGRGWNPLAAAALLGLLGIMLLVGVLIGKDENDEQPAATAPPAQTTPTTGATAPPAVPPTTTPPTSTAPSVTTTPGAGTGAGATGGDTKPETEVGSQAPAQQGAGR